MFDSIKLPVCPVCGARCTTVESDEALTLTFACGAKCSQTTEEDGNCKFSYDPRDADEIAKDAARQRHAEVSADVAQRLKAAQDEQEKGYRTSV